MLDARRDAGLATDTQSRLKAVLSGRGEEIVDLAKINLFR
jgi:hypothetical protein